LALLWLYILLDLAKTSMLEHLQNLKQRPSIFNKMLLAFRHNPTLRNTFITLFGTVVVLVLGLSVLLAVLAPEQYQSMARIKVERTGSDNTPEAYRRYTVGSYDPYFIRKQFELIQSESVLSRVARKLDLAESWGKASGGGAPLTEAETTSLLRQRLDLRPVRNTSLIEVRVYSQNPKEAATIANVLAETYREFRSDQRRSGVGTETLTSRSVQIVDTAVPALRPIRPNKPFTLFLGLFGGILLALVVGGVGVLLVLLKRRLSGQSPATT
jgi:uncharacterized protein involved in exopolysaccharide biosynthesis